ncbi:hypothetical protein GCM10022420_042790 [Streptomyces iranensis]|uniref:Helix-turn-helix domain protein n=1 Tax=Streptomyces iranensis TaxID=576784 RepID=A0A060ZBT4_9ACTN|nr:transcriptional regulator with XRE-family HTH domain [Streptomyces iranensis]CDR01302.1 helix-turn-helix domain protein [Streptomyces iranensis]
MDRLELARVLKAARACIAPEEVGLAAGPRRRVAGLCREEAAQLAGLSVEYVVRLEQGRGPRPSAQVLTALPQALRLERDAAAFLRISIVFCCSAFCRRSRVSSSRSALVSSPGPPSPRSIRSRLTQLRGLSGLTPRSRATSVIVLLEERANAIASRLNSSEYRFEY